MARKRTNNAFNNSRFVNLILIGLFMVPGILLSQIHEDTLRMVEEKYGPQWDFCACVVKNDSINNVFSNPNLSDEEFDKIVERFNVIDQHCKAFLLMSPGKTPEARLQHEQRVRECLKREK